MIGTTELMIILGIAALIFGSSKLPSIARDVGKALGEVNKAEKELDRLKSDFTSEIQSSIQGPIQSTMESAEPTMQSEPVPEQVPEKKSDDTDNIEEPHEPDIEGRIKDEAFKYIGSRFKSKIFK
ncbi:MAG: twin-arginine translocase TatA/TatE family subunit [Methanocellales archaeon]|nr:twin-arginine translocase TatA/TatE family subunit [Methanocellales archaeon]MDD3290950.1 twin-arginine translocase TatA/TatE family subunit [Methanocellales archaeon]MDD5234835.1 twin-arginine translocase TatA/TatE family subunit [Methanocellales archaeon]MDD5484795.1 twin-arginine translocase TatA/TatE family subunit [Methanocellales archaeon]